jgi:hypothetical protein
MSDSYGAAHFQLFGADSRGSIKWRLLSGNNRELGRSADGYPDAELCQLAVKSFAESIDDLVPQVRRRANSGWGWVLLDDDRPVVSSGHPYDRQVRCEQALGTFCELARNARTGTVVVLSGARRWAHPSQGRQPITLNSGVERRPRLSRPAS